VLTALPVCNARLCDWRDSFLEALCRMSQLKALPTDDEIAAATAADAPSYMHHLAEEHPAAYHTMLVQESAPWGRPKHRQPVCRCVEHLCHMLLWQVQGGVKRTAKDGDYVISEKQVERFMRVAVG
jgi:hypothetical protein